MIRSNSTASAIHFYCSWRCHDSRPLRIVILAKILLPSSGDVDIWSVNTNPVGEVGVLEALPVAYWKELAVLDESPRRLSVI
jgi:hypothetical protein